MSIHEKRTIAELIARYQLEPTLRDIYVEGELDKGVFNWSLGADERSRATIYEISTVEMPTEEILRLGLHDNNRGRVITLAHILGQHLPHNSAQITCVVDTDLDSILGVEHRHDFLLLTDYTCLEMYLYNPHTIHKFLQVAIHNFPKPAEVVLQELLLHLKVSF